MRRAIAVMIFIMLLFTAHADTYGVCNTRSREGWLINVDNVNAIREWIDDAEIDCWYTHISGVLSYGDKHVAFACTDVYGRVLSVAEVYTYLDKLMALKPSTAVSIDADELGIIEGIFDDCQTAVAYTFFIHLEMYKQELKANYSPSVFTGRL